MLRPFRSDAPPGGEPTAILIRTPNWLGDLLMSTAFVRTVLERFPEARVDLVVRAGFEVLPLPHRGRVIPYDRKAEKPGAFGRHLRGQGYSHCFVLPPSFSSAWMAWSSGIPWRIGYRGDGRALLLHPARAHRHGPRQVHLVQEYLDLLRPWMEAEATEHLPGLALPEGWMAEHLPAPLRKLPPYVVLAPGAEYGPAKQWPEPYYRQVAEGLAAEGWHVIVVGLPKDRDMGTRLIAGLPGAKNLCGETDLRQLTALLARAKLLISNDSGAMHLGAALGLRQVALFGSTNPTWTRPLNPRAAVLYLGIECSPCYARECPLHHLRCLVELPPEQVLERAGTLLRP